MQCCRTRGKTCANQRNMQTCIRSRCLIHRCLKLVPSLSSASKRHLPNAWLWSHRYSLRQCFDWSPEKGATLCEVAMRCSWIPNQGSYELFHLKFIWFRQKYELKTTKQATLCFMFPTCIAVKKDLKNALQTYQREQENTLLSKQQKDWRATMCKQDQISQKSTSNQSTPWNPAVLYPQPINQTNQPSPKTGDPPSVGSRAVCELGGVPGAAHQTKLRSIEEHWLSRVANCTGWAAWSSCSTKNIYRCCSHLNSFHKPHTSSIPD